MNILQIQDDLKNFSEQQLINEMQRPSGNAPQYLVLSEINRRKRVKSDFEANKAADTNTVAEEAVASAGVPMEGMRGMAEAMAPKSESSLVAQPQGMRTGGLMNFGREINREISEDVSPFLDEVANMAENRFNIKLDSMENQLAQMRPMIDEASDTMPQPAVMDRQLLFGGNQPSRNTSIPFARLSGISRLSGLGGKGRSSAIPFNEGGVINAFSGKYFDSSGRPTNELLNAMILQESGGDPKAIGGIGERGLGQIRPTTAIMPGYGVQSLFPELAKQIGKGKKYATAQDAYLDNKEMIDAKLEEGDTSRKFMSNLLTGFRKNTDTDAGAISAYNVGMGGLKNLSNPADFKYFTEVTEKMKTKQYDGRPIKSGPFSAEAGTLDDGNKELNAAQKRAAKRGGGAGGPDSFSDLFTSKVSGATGQMKRGDAFGINPIIEEDQSLKNKSRAEKRTIQKQREEQLRNYDFKNEGAIDIYSEGDFDIPTDEEAKKFFDDRGVVQKTTEKPAPTKPDDTGKALTLDEQLASMQEDLKKSRNQHKWLAIAQAGLSIMASDKPTLGGAIGEGASVGLQAYRDAQERYNEGIIDVLNARAKLKGKSSAFGIKDILTRVTAIDNSIAKEREALSKILDPKSDDAKAIRAKINKLTNLRDNLSVMAGFEPFSVSSEDRKKTIASS